MKTCILFITRMLFVAGVGQLMITNIHAVSAEENKTVYKILTQDEWEEFQRTASFSGNLLDLKDNFMHAAYADQIENVLNKFFKDKPVYILELSPKTIKSHLRAEANKPGGDIYPHLYGLTLNLDDVKLVKKYDKTHCEIAF